MAASRLTCPECSKILKPTRPVAAGKKVKCPHCETIFTAGPDDDEDEAPQPRAAPKRKTAPDKGGARKPAAKAPAVKAQPKKDDNDAEEGVYGYLQDPSEKEAEEKKPKISYAPDMSIKDLRGPAQALLMSPSNKLTLCGFLGFFGWLTLIVLLTIPALFPITEDKDKPKPVMKIGPGLGAVDPNAGKAVGSLSLGTGVGTEQARKVPEEEKSSFYEIAQVDLSLLCELAWYYFLMTLVPLVIFAFYSALVAYGAIQMQNIESRGWGIAASIMAMLPINLGGLMLVVGMVVQLVLGMVMDDVQFIGTVTIILSSVLYLAGIGVGIWSLMTLNNEDVIAGFEYDPE
jgi:hypothetical protein